MRKLFSILFVFALTLGFVAGEKRIVGVRVNNQVMLLRIDLANYAMDCSIDGTNWNAISGTGEAIIADNSLTLAKLVQIPTGSILGNVSGSNGNVSPLSSSDLRTLIGNATTSAAGLMSSTDKTMLGSRAASGANSDITSLTGLTTALSVTQGGTGLSALGAAGQVLAVNAGATALEFTTVSGVSGSGDVTGPSSATDGHVVAFDGITGKIIKDSGVAVSGLATSGANSNITSLSGLTTALSVAQGGTGATSASNARTALSAAASGSNSDITSLTGLTTALSIAQGGTGSTTASAALAALGGMSNPMTTAGDFIIGGTSGAPARLGIGTAGQVLTVNSGATAAWWADPSGGVTSYLDLTDTPIDLSGYGASYDGHYARFSYSSGDENTMFCLHFDDSTSDATGHIGTATVTGTANYVTGKFSKAFHFDAASEYGPINYSYNASYFDFNDTQKMTFEFWIKTTDSSSYSDGKYVFAHPGDPAVKDTRFYVYFNSGALLFKTSRNDASPSTKDINMGSVADGAWHHCAVTYNGSGTVKTWLDGNLIATESYNCMSAGAYGGDGFSFGANHYGTSGVGGVFDLDEVRMTVGQELYTTAFTPPVVPFSASVLRSLYIDSSPGFIVAVSSQTSSYALVLSDAGKLITMSNASANTLTIPLNSSVAFPVGTWIDVSNIGAGTCTITAASGVTLNGTDAGTKDLAQWAGTRLYKIDTNTWITR